jgi:hypothetical protein
LAVVKKPGRKSANAPNSTAKTANTIPCWLSRIVSHPEVCSYFGLFKIFTRFMGECKLGGSMSADAAPALARNEAQRT